MHNKYIHLVLSELCIVHTYIHKVLHNNQAPLCSSVCWLTSLCKIMMTQFLFFCLFVILAQWLLKHWRCINICRKSLAAWRPKAVFSPSWNRKKTVWWEKQGFLFLSMQSECYSTPWWKGEETIFVFLCYLLKIKTIMYEVTFKVISMQHGNDYENKIFRICLKICVSSSVLHLFM